MAIQRTKRELHGWYRADEVGRLAGVSGDRVGQWARHGYIQSSRQSTTPRAYAYQDVAEAILVHRLIVEGVPRKWIKSTIGDLRSKLGDWPLQNAKLILGGDKPGRSRHLHFRWRGSIYDSSVKHGQVVAEDWAPALIDVVDVLSRGGWATQQLQLQHIEVDPFRMSGRPSIKGRRMTIEDVVTIYSESGGERALLRSDYGLSDDQISDAVRWWRATEQPALAA